MSGLEVHLPGSGNRTEDLSDRLGYLPSRLVRMLTKYHEQSIVRIECQRHDSLMSFLPIGGGLTDACIGVPKLRGKTCDTKARLDRLSPILTIVHEVQVPIVKMPVYVPNRGVGVGRGVSEVRFQRQLRYG